MRTRGWRALLLAGAWLAAAWPVAAHDSWLSPSPAGAPGGPVQLELTTGNRFPVQEFSQSAASVEQSQCSDGAGRMPLRAVREQPLWLELVAGGGAGGPRPLACWVALGAVETEIEPRLVDVYLNEIRAPLAVRQGWQAQRAQGLPWRESYRKFARIELSEAAARTGERAAARRPVGLGLEIVVLGDQAIGVGRPLTFQVLRDGAPLPGLAIELVSERSPIGIWRVTDDGGQLTHSLPFGGRWLLRGTELIASAPAGTWQSRFVTLAIEAP